MTDRWYHITTWCKWCNGEGYTTDNNPSKRRTRCIECEGKGITHYMEDFDSYEKTIYIYSDYEDVKDIRVIEDKNVSWGSPTLSME